MPTPVWTLSVDLQTKTATFQSGMADAAKAARGSFNDIKAGANDMGRSVGGSMTEARHGVMLLGEEFGIHLPRALTSFIASIGPVGAAMEAAFPFLAIIVGATLLLEHLAKLKEEGSKLTESQVNFGTATANVLNSLNEKLLQAGIRTDELNHDHLGALHKQLELIDRQSMNELVQSFGVVSKAADLTFAQLKTSWYQWGAGSAGAKNALEEFKTEYDSLLAHGKDQEANDLLAGTKASAERVLELQKQVKNNQTTTGTHGTHQGDYNKFEEAKIALQKQGIGYSEKEVSAQQILVDALQAQVSVQAKANELKAAQRDNAEQSTQNKVSGDADKALREQAASERRGMEEAQKAWEENYKRAVSDLQENERQKIDATERGSRARLAAIDAAIKEENAKGLQETGFYKGLLTSRVQVAKQADDEEKKLAAEAGKETAEHTEKMGELELAAARENGQMRMAQTRMTSQQILDMELSFAARDYNLKKDALNNELNALNQSDKEYENKKKTLNDKLLELDAQFHNQDQQLEDQAQKKKLATIQASENQMRSAFAQGFAEVLTHKQSFAQMMAQMDSKMAATALQNAMESLMQKKGVDGETRFEDARTAAANAFEWAGNPILGAIAAAGAFASVMAFETGGIVPGVGKGDSVRAMLTPGEAVLPKALTERLLSSARSDSAGSGGDTHLHMHISHNVQALDSAGFKQVLDKHSDTLANHLHSQIRKMNKG